jgi:hypothetical protein
MEGGKEKQGYLCFATRKLSDAGTFSHLILFFKILLMVLRSTL